MVGADGLGSALGAHEGLCLFVTLAGWNWELKKTARCLAGTHICGQRQMWGTRLESQ